MCKTSLKWMNKPIRWMHPKRETQFLCKERYKYLKFQAGFKAQKNKMKGKTELILLSLQHLNKSQFYSLFLPLKSCGTSDMELIWHNCTPLFDGSLWTRPWASFLYDGTRRGGTASFLCPASALPPHLTCSKTGMIDSLLGARHHAEYHASHLTFTTTLRKYVPFSSLAKWDTWGSCG